MGTQTTGLVSRFFWQVYRFDRRFGWRLLVDLQQFAAATEIGRSFAAVIATVTTGPGKPFRQDVQCPALHERPAVQAIRFGDVHPPAALVFFTLLGSGPELDFVFADVDQPAIADWSAGQVACQILDDLAWLTLPVGWALNENVPVHRFEFLQPSLSLSGVVQEVDSATQLEFPLGQQAAKRPDVVLAEGLAQLHVVGQVRFLAASMLRMSRGLPAATVGCRSASGYQCVKVRVVLELLVPRVEHHQRCGVVDHGGDEAGVSHQLADRQQIDARFEHPRRPAVSQRVRRDGGLGDSRFGNGQLAGFLNGCRREGDVGGLAWEQVVAGPVDLPVSSQGFQQSRGGGNDPALAPLSLADRQLLFGARRCRALAGGWLR